MPFNIGQWAPIGPTLINDSSLGSIGRIHSIAVHPTTPATLWAGGPNCGIWKTTDGGVSWTSIGDSLPTLAVAALTVNPLTPTCIYAVMAESGVFQSQDGGVTWRQIAGDQGTISGAGVLLIHPTNPSILYLTSRYGLFRSADAGVNWTQAKTGNANDVVMDPSNPATIYVALQGDGIYKTSSGGATGESAWTKLPGLPSTGFTRVTLALCNAFPTTIYAGLSGNPFCIYRSTDGVTFSLRYTAPSSIYNPWLGVDPINPAIVYLPSANFQRSTNGGASFMVTSGDLHECQKLVTNTMLQGVIYLGRDNGLFVSRDQGVTFAQVGAGIANVEFYDGALAATNPGEMIGGTQDNGTIKYDGISTVWKRILDGDGATVDIDPTNDQILYGMDQYASSISRSTNGGGSFSNFAAGLPTGSVCFNLQFLVHPTTPAILLACCTSLWRITSPTGTWEIIFTPTNDNVVRAAVDASIDLYYAGTSGGKLYAGLNGTSLQQQFVHPNNAGFTDLHVDPDDSTVVYATFSGSSIARIYRLKRSVTSPPFSLAAVDITANLPNGLNVNTIAVDRMAPFTVYVGTNRGIYRGISGNAGTNWSWTSYNNGLPFPKITALRIHPRSGVMRATTFGRSAYEVYTDWPIGTLAEASGRITLLRVHDVGTGWGPANDFIDVEVVVMLDSMPERGFGFQLRADKEEYARRGMLDLLRVAFNRNSFITIDYIKTGFRNGSILRVADT